MKIQVAILAAGNSSRLGRPKQLVQWQGKPLIRYVTEEALAISNPNVTLEHCVVVGAYAGAVAEALHSLPLQILINPDWSEGMASSVRVATQYAIQQQADAILFALTDQPFMNTSLLEQFILTYLEVNDSSCVVVSDYGSDWGVPLLIGAAYFESLLQLKGDSGVKRYVKQRQLAVKKVTFLRGLIDIDTEHDLMHLQERQ
ncbi:nucleotidyltransferase family protein [Siphonobacter sp. SORGH_AS_0500]|uniref:nucleotidyltransferase family protein n=1 Tax=Siphonobacter sp. SORGH_AS_0500 TaxID=1864824 RepID=UPI0028542932|nr:nucleotidyltransferase family protein [Siphonobacter sp. SORGH_AS_0500]MDR6195978.1 molybdenum cofactor cytidylyltransferase [Siphonobacter sp. SORGH_AS_0500]